MCFLVLGGVGIYTAAWYYDDDIAEPMGIDSATGTSVVAYIITVVAIVAMCWGACYCTGAIAATKSERLLAAQRQVMQLQQWVARRVQGQTAHAMPAQLI
jgi:hypothetical protein